MQPIIPYFQIIKFDIPLPEFISATPISIYGFGISLAIGLIVGGRLVFARARAHGIDSSKLELGFVLAIFGVVVGGHVGYGLMYEPAAYFAQPSKFLDLRSGMSSFGGLIFTCILLSIYIRKVKVPFWLTADCIAKGFAFGWLFGRIGCTLNHEHPGTPTNFILGRYCRPVEGFTLELPSWMVMQPPDLRFSHCIEAGKAAVTSYADKVTLDYPGVLAVHDLGFYEAIYAFIMLMVFVVLDRYRKGFNGMYTMMIVYSYGPLRFMLDFLRPVEHNPRYAGLTPAQWGCLAFMLVAAVGLRYLWLQHKRHPATAS